MTISAIKIIGLDLSLTSTGICSFHSETKLFNARAVKTSNKFKYEHRYAQILEEIKKEITGADRYIFFIEGYSFGSFPRSSSMSYLLELGGVVKFYLSNSLFEFVSVPPTLLKKFITGKGNAKKEDMKLHTYKKYGEEFKTSDATDAFGLAAMGCAYSLGVGINGKELTTIEKECIQKLRETENAA